MPVRSVAIREWSCPHHDFPVHLGHEEGERPSEALPLVRDVLKALAALGHAPEGLTEDQIHAATVEFGLCCDHAGWVTVGKRDMTALEELLFQVPPGTLLPKRHVLLDAVAENNDLGGGKVTIPLIRSSRGPDSS